MSRKYRQPGYDDRDRGGESRRPAPGRKASREGPRSPKMPGFRQMMRCAMCGASRSLEATEIGFDSRCNSCSADLHTCKNCVFFDTGSRFECTQPVLARVTPKDRRNECGFFEARTTVEKETGSAKPVKEDPRDAFERLFKK